MFKTIGFIGTGNMGGAVARAIAQASDCGKILLSNRTREKAQKLAEEIRASVKEDNEATAKESDLLFLCVKPYMMQAVLDEIRPALSKKAGRTVLCSMAAGVSCAQIQKMISMEVPIIRMMPNIPTAVGAGMIQYCTVNVSSEEGDAFCHLMERAGRTEFLDEHLIDAASAVSGCGPAFAAMFAEALADAGVACGLPRDKAVTYALQMIMGTAQMLLSNKQHPAQMKDAVCSPGGTTIQGVRALENGGFRSAVMEAVIAAYEKTKGLI